MADDFAALQASLLPDYDPPFTPTNSQSPSYPPSNSHLRQHHRSTVHSFYESPPPAQSDPSASVFPHPHQHQVHVQPHRQVTQPLVNAPTRAQPTETSAGIPPPLSIPGSYSNKTRHLALLPSLVASSGNDSNNVSSDRIFLDVPANAGVSLPCTLDDSDVPESPDSPLMISAEPPAPKDHSDPMSHVTDEYSTGMYAPSGPYSSIAKGSYERDAEPNNPYRVMSWAHPAHPPTSAPAPTSAPTPTPAPAPAHGFGGTRPSPSQQPQSVGVGAGKCVSECSLVSKDVVTPTSSPPTLSVAQSPTKIIKGMAVRRGRPRPRRRRDLKIVKPEDMDLDLVQETVEGQRDSWVADVERQFGTPADAEVKAAYDRVIRRAKLLTEKEKVNQRERKRPESQKPKEASRLEASLSRYVKEVLIQCLFVEVKALVRDGCVVQRALRQNLGQGGVEGSVDGQDNGDGDVGVNVKSEGGRKTGCTCTCTCGREDVAK